MIAPAPGSVPRRGPLAGLLLASGISLLANQLTGLALLTSLGTAIDAGDRGDRA